MWKVKKMSMKSEYALLRLNRFGFRSVWDSVHLSRIRLKGDSINRFARGFLGLDCIKNDLSPDSLTMRLVCAYPAVSGREFSSIHTFQWTRARKINGRLQ